MSYFCKHYFLLWLSYRFYSSSSFGDYRHCSETNGHTTRTAKVTTGQRLLFPWRYLLDSSEFPCYTSDTPYVFPPQYLSDFLTLCWWRSSVSTYRLTWVSTNDSHKKVSGSPMPHPCNTRECFRAYLCSFLATPPVILLCYALGHSCYHKC